MTGRRREKPSAPFLVGLGISLSRIAGLIRTGLTAAFLGRSAAADAFANALKIPNLLQNLLGEGTLSASFIPVYSELLDRNDRREAGRLAGAVASLLAIVTGLCVLAGLVLAEPLTTIVAPRATPTVRDLTVDLVRIVFIGVGFLVMSAWCLGVLNSHRRFFLSYVAPVVWNVAIIAALVSAVLSDASLADTATAMAWGVVVGGALQFLVQVPSVLRYTPLSGVNVAWRSPAVRTVVSRFWPALLGRGVVQISTYVDVMLASFLAVGGHALLFYAQTLYILAISVFAMSTAAAELPEMARLAEAPDELVERTRKGLARISFFVVFIAAAYISIGELITGAIFGWNEFDEDDATVVWLILSAMSLGLPAVGPSRLLQNTMYALGDTRGPARIAAMRVLLTAAIGLMLMFPLDQLGILDGGFEGSIGGFEPLDDATREAPGFARLGAVGLGLGLAASAWFEFLMLSRLVRRRLPSLGSPGAITARFAVPASLAFVVGATLRLVLDDVPAIVAGPLAVGICGFVYVVACHRLDLPEADLVLRPIRRLLWGGRRRQH